MGFSYRKSVRVGPIRLNMTSRGLGASIGVRGARVGKRAGSRGFYLNAGRRGVRYRKRF